MTPILIGACARPGAVSAPTMRPTRSIASQRFCIEMTSMGQVCSSAAGAAGHRNDNRGGILRGGHELSMIIRELQRLHRARGFVPRAELSTVAARLGVPLYRVHEVVSFFPQFRTTPPPEVDVRVCRDMTCRLRGGGELLDACQALAAVRPPEQLAVEGVSCLGRCDRAH